MKLGLTVNYLAKKMCIVLKNPLLRGKVLHYPFSLWADFLGKLPASKQHNQIKKKKATNKNTPETPTNNLNALESTCSQLFFNCL